MILLTYDIAESIRILGSTILYNSLPRERIGSACIEKNERKSKGKNFGRKKGEKCYLRVGYICKVFPNAMEIRI